MQYEDGAHVAHCDQGSFCILECRLLNGKVAAISQRDTFLEEAKQYGLVMRSDSGRVAYRVVIKEGKLSAFHQPNLIGAATEIGPKYVLGSGNILSVNTKKKM